MQYCRENVEQVLIDTNEKIIFPDNWRDLEFHVTEPEGEDNCKHHPSIHPSFLLRWMPSSFDCMLSHALMLEQLSIITYCLIPFLQFIHEGNSASGNEIFIVD